MWNEIKAFVNEMITHWKRTFRVAYFEIKSQDKGTLFGIYWNVLNPLFQIIVYWFVFSVALNIRLKDNRFPYVVWLITGLLPWMNINNAIQSGSRAVFSFSRVIKNVRIPPSMIPLRTVFIAEIKHMLTLMIMYPCLLLLQVPFEIYHFQLIYYVLAEFFFLLSVTILTSAINVLFQDFHLMLGHIMRLLFYISSVTWPIEQLPQKMQWVLRLNPIAYLIEGYRNSLLYCTAAPIVQTLYFWIITIMIFAIGCRLYSQIQDYFVDVL